MNPLLADHLARCLRDPANAPRWHQLAALCAGADDIERAGMVEALGAADALAATAAPNANLLRLGFIAGLDPAGGAREAAARQILDDAPVNPDCMAGWMSYAALAALQGGADRASFAQALSSAHVPEMASRLAARVTAIRQDCAELPRRTPQSIARVALILPYVGNAMHTPSTLALNHARVVGTLNNQHRACQVVQVCAWRTVHQDIVVTLGMTHGLVEIGFPRFRQPVNKGEQVIGAKHIDRCLPQLRVPTGQGQRHVAAIRSPHHAYSFEIQARV